MQARTTSDPAARQRASGPGLWARADRATRDESRARSLWASGGAREIGGAREKGPSAAGSAAGGAATGAPGGAGASGSAAGSAASGAGAAGGAAAATPLTFTLEDYQAPSGGTLGGSTGDLGIDLRPPFFFFNAQVKVSGGTAAEAKQWESGGTQTVYESTRKGHYVDGSGNEVKVNWDYVRSLPATDSASGDRLPWYRGTHTAYMSTPDSVFSGVTDRPNTEFPWKGPKGKGATDAPTLARTTGTDKFCAWIISRNKRTKEIRYHKWCSWEVDYGTTVNATAQTANPTTGASRITGSGAGKGSMTPALTGPRSMTSISVVWKAP